MPKHQIAASILSADFARLGEEVETVLAAGSDLIHFDVMDNHFVPNLTIGPLVCRALRQYGIKAAIDVHLMTNPVDHLITEFAKAGASLISFHPEASQDVHRSLQLIRDHGCKAGLALNPETSLDQLDSVLDKIDFVLMMSVNPGFAGQRFIPESLEKIKAAKKIVSHANHFISLAVDGGVKLDNIKAIADAGADTFVMGSAIFETENYHETIRQLREKLCS